ncbi:hypothetical protein GUITHDRAFT_105588 [Guillardia theta CCMP2712]|uniref:Uncharacterized protein n=1 Tax=Guillardia theta (strain CCMP2712) TaxID=905079 RepID=L1JK19_GUITC|nr:hypothetical protein GUITHDRAFT_105588 [Guillardia theta CCMP2712]EKX48440.1 hypothetical protein GUITHDRAFT_105588 [Guillardia theta CCMP2712]|eukprot:XP_005835420.1 hypothetical protein GUITHDRAFT_105588 [Guillardia theta CCMP2712]
MASIEIEVEGQQSEPVLIQTPRRTDFKPGFSHAYMHVSGDFLQRSTVERKVYKINPWLILFSHEPLSALLTLRPVQFIFVVVGSLWIILESVSLHRIQSTGYFSLFPNKAGSREFLHQDFLGKNHLPCTWELSLQLATSNSHVKVLIFAGFLDGLFNSIIFFGMLAEGYNETALEASRHEFLIYAISDLFFFPAPLIFSELYVVEQVFLAHIMIFASALGAGRVRYESIFVFAATVFFLACRELTRSRTLSEALHSSSVFEKEWEEVKGSQSIFRLMNSLRNVRGWGPYGPTFILPNSADNHIPGESETNKEIDEENLRRENLDQLYAQALVIDPVFLSKVKALAEASDGFFLAQSDNDEPQYVRWRDVIADPTLESSVCWAKIKNATRSIEKVLLLCDTKVPRLTDVVRQSIVFKDLDQLCDCLDKIARDPEIQVLQIKNRLDPDFDSKISGGYRDVAINLRVVSDETRKKGVEGHICELQLILVDFHKLKTLEGHKRYVQFRNLRCE